MDRVITKFVSTPQPDGTIEVRVAGWSDAYPDNVFTIVPHPRIAELEAEVARLKSQTIGLIHTGTDELGPYAYRDLPGGHRLTVDLEDVAYLSYPLRIQAEFSVSSTRPYYAVMVRSREGKKRRSMSLARLIARPQPGEHTDHEDQNTFNNRRYNLRNVTPQENMGNKRPYVSPVSSEAKHYSRTAADPLEEVK